MNVCMTGPVDESLYAEVVVGSIEVRADGHGTGTGHAVQQALELPQ